MIDFRRDARGRLDVDADPHETVLATFLEMDTGLSSQSVDWWVGWTEDARDGRGDQEWQVGEGFSLRVRSEETLFASNLRLFPDTTYPTEQVLDVLRRLRDWLRAERAGRDADRPSEGEGAEPA